MKSVFLAVLVAVIALFADARVTVAGLTVDDIYDRQGEPEVWAPPVRARLIDVDFFTPGGKVHFIGKFDDYNPESGHSVVLFSADGNESAQVDSAGNFMADISIDYPRSLWFKLGDFRGGVFVSPGDTIRYNAKTQKTRTLSPDGKEVWEKGYEIVDCDNPATIEVNLLKDVLADSIGDLMVEFVDWRGVSSHGYDSVMAFGEKIKGFTREAVARLTELLTPLDISPKAKDMLFTMLLVDVNTPLMDVAMFYGDNKMIRRIDENGKKIIEQNPDYVELDYQKYYGGQEDYIAYLWDNPYMICDGDMYINRLEFSPIKSLVRHMASGYEGIVVLENLSVFNFSEEIAGYGSRRGWLENYMRGQEAEYGSGNDFFSQYLITKGVLGLIGASEANSEALGRVLAMGADMMRLVDYKTLQDLYHKALIDLAKRVAVKEAGSVVSEPSRLIEDKSEILASIVAPYKGRVVYVDVWDANCGPCRAGMISQKEILDQFKDAPLTVIYVAPESNRKACEKFLKENNIKGEHVFLSNDDDARFKSDFDIQAIPFGILIKKNGEYTTDFPCNLDYVFAKALAD